MYTILVTNENELRVTVKERIMQRSKLVDSFHFLVDQLYKDNIDMTEFILACNFDKNSSVCFYPDENTAFVRPTLNGSPLNDGRTIMLF